jgi:hypothetical protein
MSGASIQSLLRTLTLAAILACSACVGVDHSVRLACGTTEVQASTEIAIELEEQTEIPARLLEQVEGMVVAFVTEANAAGGEWTWSRAQDGGSVGKAGWFIQGTAPLGQLSLLGVLVDVQTVESSTVFDFSASADPRFVRQVNAMNTTGEDLELNLNLDLVGPGIESHNAEFSSTYERTTESGLDLSWSQLDERDTAATVRIRIMECPVDYSTPLNTAIVGLSAATVGLAVMWAGRHWGQISSALEKPDIDGRWLLKWMLAGNLGWLLGRFFAGSAGLNFMRLHTIVFTVLPPLTLAEKLHDALWWGGGVGAGIGLAQWCIIRRPRLGFVIWPLASAAGLAAAVVAKDRFELAAAALLFPLVAGGLQSLWLARTRPLFPFWFLASLSGALMALPSVHFLLGLNLYLLATGFVANVLLGENKAPRKKLRKSRLAAKKR